jgi:hypothetical protein
LLPIRVHFAAMLQLTQQFVLAAVKPVQADGDKIAPRSQSQYCNIMVINLLTSKYLDYVSLVTQLMFFDAYSSVNCNYYTRYLWHFLYPLLQVITQLYAMTDTSLSRHIWRRRPIQILTEAFSVLRNELKAQVCKTSSHHVFIFGKVRIETRKWFLRIIRCSPTIPIVVIFERGRALCYKFVAKIS